MSANPLYVGIMSGTSLDGVDAVLANFSGGAPRMIGNHFRPYPDDLRRSLLALQDVGSNELHRAALLSNTVTEEYAAAVEALLGPHGEPGVAAIGCHGQTVRHRPEAGYTIQLVNGALLAERTGLTAITDFRSRDIAAGGEGAPLVPAFHEACFRHASQTRAIINIGGIANITCLPCAGPISGFDTGPGNLLMDGWVRRQLGADFDRDGAYAASGSIDAGLLARMLADSYFHRAPPKSTGRDHFNMAWLETFDIAAMDARHVQATLAELSAASIAAAVTAHCPAAREVFVCGGGAHNRHLLSRLAEQLPDRSIASTEALGMDPDWVEALAFAWLASRTLQSLPGNAPAVTGAKAPRVLGAIHQK